MGNFQCPDWVEYPIDVYYATGGLVGKEAVICGGGFPTTDECYKITANKAVMVGKMNTERYYAASVVINSTTLWVTGGDFENDNYLSSTEFVNLEKGSIEGGNSGCKLFMMTHSRLNDLLRFVRPIELSCF